MSYICQYQILISALSAEVGYYYYAEMLAILKLQFNTNHNLQGPLNEGSLFYNKMWHDIVTRANL